MRALLLLLGPLVAGPASAAAQDPPRPNVILWMADDLGWGEVGYQGQERIRTPHIDRLAAEGVQFSAAYSGHTVCAPSRCVLMTGLHTGHAQIRENSPWASRLHALGEGQEPLRFGTQTLGTLLRQAGYRTGAFGKWGLGAPHDEGRPLAQGFDSFTGYLCQKQAHDHYPPALWQDGAPLPLRNPGYTPSRRLEALPEEDSFWEQFSGKDYAEDVMLEAALAFVDRAHAEERPFFLYFPTPVPHAALQVPEDSLAPYLAEGWEDPPYLGTKGYLPHPTPRAAYAAMISRMDRDLGALLERVERLGLAEETLVLFTSDNGATFNGGVDRAFFRSNGPFRGMKTTLYEGGIRVPLVARWPGRIPAGVTCDEPVGFQDLLPTLAELAGVEPWGALDGVSLAPVLEDPAAELAERPLYFESNRRQALRLGRWKLHRTLRQGDEDGEYEERLELYDLLEDPEESEDLTARHPQVVERLVALMAAEHEPSARFPTPEDPPLFDARAPGPFEVQRTPLRTTRADGASIGAVVHQPEQAASTERELVLFQHGWLGSARDYEELCDHLASHGFVVLSNDTQTGLLASPVVEARDTLLLAEALLRSTGVLTAPVTQSGWGAVGHSMGGIASLRLAAGSKRIGAVCALQPGWPRAMDQTARAVEGMRMPVFVLTGGDDRTCPPSGSRPLAEAAPSGARRLWATVPGLGHLGPVDGRWQRGGLPADEAHALHRELVLDYLLATLRGDAGADERLVRRRDGWRVGRPEALP